MTEQQFKDRTKQLALAVLRVADELPPGRLNSILAGQLVRAATSVGANYRAACRARSTPDMISKLGIVEEEADETLYWLDLLVESGRLPDLRVEPLRREANDLLAMTVASIKTLRARRQTPLQNPKI